MHNKNAVNVDKTQKSPGFLPQIADEENHPLSPSLSKEGGLVKVRVYKRITAVSQSLNKEGGFFLYVVIMRLR